MKFPAWIISVLFAAGLGFSSPASAANTAVAARAKQPRTLTVFAAASLTDAFKEIGRKFEIAHPGVTVRFHFAASNLLALQINEGGPADVFASASEKTMARVADAGNSDSPASILLRNRLVAVVPHDNPAGIHAYADLARPGTKVVLAAPGVPAGDYARESLMKAGILDAVMANVVSNEQSVRSALSKVAMGEADASIVYASDAAARPGVKSIPIADEVNVIAVYPIAVIRTSTQADWARAFVEFTAQPAAQSVLKAYGFLPAR